MDTESHEAAPGESDGVSMTLMERGSQWPEHARVIPSMTSENIVMVQGAQEAPEAFAARVTNRLNEVRASGWPLKSAMLVASGTPGGSSTVDARLATILGGFLPRHGTLTLVGTVAQPSDARAELADLAVELSEFFGSGLSVRLVIEPRQTHREFSEHAA